MRRFVLTATVCMAALAGSAAGANDQLYKCLDANGTLLLTDKPCAVVESVPADAAPQGAQGDVADVPMDVGVAAPSEQPRRVVKEHYTLPPAELERTQASRRVPVSAAPKIDVATLKAAKLNLELGNRTASLP